MWTKGRQFALHFLTIWQQFSFRTFAREDWRRAIGGESRQRIGEASVSARHWFAAASRKFARQPESAGQDRGKFPTFHAAANGGEIPMGGIDPAKKRQRENGGKRFGVRPAFTTLSCKVVNAGLTLLDP